MWGLIKPVSLTGDFTPASTVFTFSAGYDVNMLLGTVLESWNINILCLAISPVAQLNRKFIFAFSSCSFSV